MSEGRSGLNESFARFALSILFVISLAEFPGSPTEVTLPTSGVGKSSLPLCVESDPATVEALATTSQAEKALLSHSTLAGKYATLFSDNSTTYSFIT